MNCLNTKAMWKINSFTTILSSLVSNPEHFKLTKCTTLWPKSIAGTRKSYFNCADEFNLISCFWICAQRTTAMIVPGLTSWFPMELTILGADRKDRGLWERDCFERMMLTCLCFFHRFRWSAWSRMERTDQILQSSCWHRKDDNRKRKREWGCVGIQKPSEISFALPQ